MRSATRDGNLRVVLVESDIDPGTFYLFDTQARGASLIVVRDEQIDSTRMSAMKPVELKPVMASPCMVHHPAEGAGDRALPLVVMPHGGPFGS